MPIKTFSIAIQVQLLRVSCLVHYFVTWFDSVFLLDNTNSTLSCPSNNFVGNLVDFRFNDSEAVEYKFIGSV